MTEKAIQKYLERNWDRMFGLNLKLIKTEHELLFFDGVRGKSIDIIAESHLGEIYLIELKNKTSLWIDACKIVGYKGLFCFYNYKAKDYKPTIMIPEPEKSEKSLIEESLSWVGIKHIFYTINEKEKSVEIVDWSL